MRKILIGTLVACMSLLGLAGMAAADFSWSGWVDFGMTGTSDGASGVFADSAGIDVEARATAVEDGISEVRKLFHPALADPKIHIDRGCRRLIADLSTYSYKPESDDPEKGHMGNI